MSAPLDGRRILVTGASAGIGAATVRACVDAGARVAMLARRAERLREIEAELGAATATPADVTDRTQVAEAVQLAARRMGGLDAVVNAAGLNLAAGFREGDPDHWRRMLETNLYGVFLVTAAALPVMIGGGGGDVLNVSSMSGHRVASPDAGVYAATKAGLNAWSEALRREVGPLGVRVMTLSPGRVATEFTSHIPDPELRAERQRRSARTGLPAGDVAAQVVHMLSQPARVRLHEIAIMPSAQD